jgi:hypothetical protein|tara:strand:+ start:231 stop:425 length:195 start_codon:yes stop_codon:yes gene_type:complete
MENDSVSPEGVIADLADQNRKLSVDCAVLRTAVKQLQAELAEFRNPPPPALSDGLGEVIGNDAE